MESILKSIKKLLGIPEDYDCFDQDIIMHINSVFMVLNQLGVGPDKCFTIEDDTSEWVDFMEDKENIEAVKTYVYLRVRLLFDPPANSTMLKSIEDSIKEYEFRLNIMASSDVN